jgi:phosphonate metabolism protein (transferase hexapeptide repeat family)
MSDRFAMPQTLPKITRTPVIHPTAKIKNVDLGDYVEIHDFVQARDSTIGSYSYLQEYVSVLNVEMGRFCAIAAMTRIGAPNHPYKRVTQHRISYVPEYYWGSGQRDAEFFSDRSADKCIVGNDVWMGHGATVLPGVAIGDGAVVAAGAIVTKTVEPYAIVAGNPARTIKRRFTRQLSDRLQALQWWLWTHDKLGGAVTDFRTLSIEAFLEKHRG